MARRGSEELQPATPGVPRRSSEAWPRARTSQHSIVIACMLIAVGVAFIQPPIAQDPAYHHFADRRSFFAVPNGFDVLSNAGFAVVGWLGLALVVRSAATRVSTTRTERTAYALLFAGTLLTAFGSAYYHLAPDNARLVWDRLPMTIGFMGLVAAVVAERVDIGLARWLLLPLLVLGAASVWYWHWSEGTGAGDLRFYGLVQFGSLLLVVLLLLLYRSPYPGTAYFWLALAAYGAAKLFEALDHEIFDSTRLVSGHTLKHLTAAAAIGCVVLMLNRRRRAL